MSATASAVSQPANTKSAKNGEVQAPTDPEWFRKLVLLEGCQAPFAIGTSNSRVVVSGRDKLAAGYLDGLVLEQRIDPATGLIAFKVEQRTPSKDRPHGSIGYAFMLPTGVIAVRANE